VTDKFNIIVTGDGINNLSLMVVDLADEARAFAMAKRLADQTGRAVRVRDAMGIVLGTVPGAKRN
jgi:hypothetical protein